MAAKPPKPPGNSLKSLLNQHNNNKNHQQQLQQQHNNEDNDIESNSSGQAVTSIATDCNTAITPAIAATTKRTNCNCSNISIMHLFHEMKQEFPTIPDTIVAQCVNENCHQRENCIQMLRNELELNPIPAQSYPAKVLHPPNNNNNNSNNIQQNNTTNHINNNNNSSSGNTTTLQKPPLQQKPVVVQQKPPLKPIKPIRTAPLQPPSSSVQQSNNNNNNNNCAKTNSIFAKNTRTTNKQLAGGEDIANNEGGCGGGGGGGPVGQIESNDMPSKITPQYKQSIATNTVNSTTTAAATEVNNNDNVCVGETVERNLPRQRPTTLNLNTQLQKQQQQQRQRLNVQLQQRFQEQRNRQQQQQQQQQQQPQNPTIIAKPLRKAPLPPIAPKPSHYQLTNHTNNTNTNAVNSGFLNDSLSSPNHTTTTTTNSPLSESEISVSVSLSTPSPTSPNTTTTHRHQQQHLQTKSPIRHRSVITLQPEPPYTRDFLFTPALITSSSTPSSPSLAAPPNTTATTTIQTTANSSSSANSSPTASVAGSQKSYTSVNLTLRPPVSPTGANPALQPSTIDITAGPGFSGASGGGKSLHYSSTSYDARLGYQQNFQITVTDEGGVFSACRLRPQQQQQQQHQQQQQRCLNQQQLQLQQQFHNNNVVALQQNIQNSIQSPHGVGSINTSSGFGGSGGISGNMCFPSEQAVDAPTQEILQRQKKKRDKLAAALREYKKRFGNVEQEINLLTGTIPTEGLSERLDEEITKLRRDCNDMLRSSNSFTQAPSQQELAINHQPQQQQPQPFPRQRLTRPLPRPPPPRQTSLDIIQHHSPSSTPHTPPAASLPNLNLYTSPQQQQQQQLNHINSPTYLHQQSEPLINNNTTMYTDHSYFADQEEPLVNDDDGEYEEIVEPQWECNMCTFRNHPQLNICETCDNVRPGMLTNLSRALSATNCTTNTAASPAGAATSASASANLGLLGGASGGGSNNALNNSNSNSSSRSGLNTANGNLEHDLVQQQLQHFALHT